MSELSEDSGGVVGFREPERVGDVGCRGRGSAGSLDEVTWKRPTSWGFPSAEKQGGSHGRRERNQWQYIKWTEDNAEGKVSGQRPHLRRWAPVWLHPGVAEQDLGRPKKCGPIRGGVIQDRAPLITPLVFLLTSLSNSAVKGEGLSWPQGARAGEGGRLGKGLEGAGGDWERSPGEGDSRDWATVITAREKALARESRGAAVGEGRGEAGEQGGKGCGVRVTGAQLGEKVGGELERTELCGNGEDGVGNWDAPGENGSGELGG